MSFVGLVPSPISGDVASEGVSLGAAPQIFWTDVKVKRAWLCAGAGLCAIGAVVTGALSFTATPWMLVGAIPLALASGALVWYAYSRFTDYEDPAELTAIRQQAMRKSLEEIVQEHGWEKLFVYELTAPERFIELYCSHVAGMSLRGEMSYHNEAALNLREAKKKNPRSSFEIPYRIEIWKEKLFRETQGFDFSKLRNFLLKTLVDYSLINPDQLRDSFCRFADKASLNETIGAYEEILNSIPRQYGYTLPELKNWKVKLSGETSGLEYSFLIGNYSLLKLIQYSLIEPGELSESFERFAKRSQLPQIIEGYEKAVKCFVNFPAFSLSSPVVWKEKFRGETIEKTATQIIDNYPVDKLLQYEIIGQEEHQILRQALDNKNQLISRKQQKRDECSANLRKTKALYEESKQNAERTYREHPARNELRNLDTTHKREVRSLESNARVQIEREQKHLAEYEKTVPPLANIAELRKECAVTCQEIQRTCDFSKLGLDLTYGIKKGVLNSTLSGAEISKNRFISLAEQQYDSARESILGSAEECINHYEQEFFRTQSKIEKDYQAFYRRLVRKEFGSSPQDL